MVVQQKSSRKIPSLSDLVESKLRDYFKDLDGQLPACRLHSAVIAQIEKPLFKVVLKKVNNNKVQASEILGMSRNTLTKKIKEYNL